MNMFIRKTINMINKNKPRVYWDEDKQYYYITFFEDTKSDEIVDAFEKFKGRPKKQQNKHDTHTNKNQRGQNEAV